MKSKRQIQMTVSRDRKTENRMKNKFYDQAAKF